MIDAVRPHFTTRRSFVAATGFAGVSLYGLWAAYGAAPGPMALLGLDHAEGAAHASGDTAGATAMPNMPVAEAGHGGHGAGPGAGPDPGEFSRLSAQFRERFRQSDGRVYPRRIAMMDAASQDAHAGHDMRESSMPTVMPMETPAPAGSQHADATHTMPARLAAPAMDDNSPIDVLMTAGKWFYLPNGLLLDAGQRYRFRMMALDVSHGASIQFGRGGRMMRLQPGRITETELRFERPGRYLVFCAVYCGEAHDVMQASIEVV